MGNMEIDYQNYDKAFKEAFTTFKEKVPPFIDIDLPEIDRFLETEFVEIATKENTTFNCNSMNYKVKAVDLSEKNGDAKLKELKECIERYGSMLECLNS